MRLGGGGVRCGARGGVRWLGDLLQGFEGEFCRILWVLGGEAVEFGGGGFFVGGGFFLVDGGGVDVVVGVG